MPNAIINKDNVPIGALAYLKPSKDNTFDKEFAGLVEIINKSTMCDCCVKCQILNGGVSHGETTYYKMSTLHLLEKL